MKIAQSQPGRLACGKGTRTGTGSVLQPEVRPVPTFEGGVIAFMFEPNYALKRYEIVTMFPRPPRGQPADGQSGN